MHEIGVETLDDHVFVCNLICHPKVMDVDVARPLGSLLTTFHDRVTYVLDCLACLVYNHRTNGKPLLLYEVLEVDNMNRGVGEANELYIGA